MVGPEINYPTPVVGVIIIKAGKILLGKRKGRFSAGNYGLPGGKMEIGETLEEAATREITEECGLQVKNFKFIFVANFIYDSGEHFVYLGLKADYESGEPVCLEPEKCEGWDWYDPKDPPAPLSEVATSALAHLATGKNYFGSHYLD